MLFRSQKATEVETPKDMHFQKDVGAFLSAVSEMRHYAERGVLVAQSCLTVCDAMDCSPSGPLSMGFSRQEY